MECNLVPQKGYSRFRGILVGTSADNFYKEGKNDNGKEWRSIQFGVKTSPEQIIYVKIYAFKNEKVYAYNKDKNQTLDFEWAKRKSLPEGFRVFGVTVADKNNILVDYDAIEEIKNNFKDGDSVFVSCQNKYSIYKDEPQTELHINSIYFTKQPVDFEADDFEEQAEFDQEMSVIETYVDKEVGKLFLTSYIIENRGKNKLPDVKTAIFTVDLNHEKPAFVKNVAKLKKYDTFKAFGIVHNRAILTETEEVDDKWGTVKPKTIKTTKKEMEIKGIYGDSFVEKKYKDSDFEVVFEQQSVEQMFNGESQTDNKENNNSFDWLD